MTIFATRAESTPEATSPANPILVAFRKHGERLFGGIEGWLAYGLSGSHCDGVPTTPAQVAHARQVLTRLAALSAEGAPGSGKTPKTHDYTMQGWGHSINYAPTGKGYDISGMMFSQDGPREGDYLILPNGDKATRYRITEIAGVRDPDDMFKFTAEFAPRTTEENAT